MQNKALVHSLIWVIYILSEYISNVYHYNSADAPKLWYSIFLSLPVVMIPTYVMTLVLIPKYLEKNKLVVFTIGLLGVAFVVLFMRLKWLEILNYINYSEYQKMPWPKVAKNVVHDYAIIALISCISILVDWRQKKKLNQELTESKTKLEIKLLKNQLQPHFLFNTLNNIYAQALQKSDNTADSILRLTNLLEYLVYWSDKESVAIHKEIELIKNYCKMEALRYGNNLDLTLDLDEMPKNLLMAPMIFLPFVENSFKHARSGANEKVWIIIRLKLYDEKVVFNVKNSVNTKERAKRGCSNGIGLENITKTLNLKYPEKHDLRIENGQNFFDVRLKIDLSE